MSYLLLESGLHDELEPHCDNVGLCLGLEGEGLELALAYCVPACAKLTSRPSARTSQGMVCLGGGKRKQRGDRVLEGQLLCIVMRC